MKRACAGKKSRIREVEKQIGDGKYGRVYKLVTARGHALAGKVARL